MPSNEANKVAKEYVDKALALDDDLAEAHNTLACYLTANYRFAERREN